MHRFALALSILSFACVRPAAIPAQAREPIETPPVVVALAPPIVFGPLDHAAAAWNAFEPAVPPSPAADAVFAALDAWVNGRGTPLRDARLDHIAAELSPIAARGGALDDLLVQFALEQHGVPDASVGAFVATAPATEPAAIAAELERALGDRLFFGNVHVGVGGSPLVVVVTHTALATLAPTTPRFVEARGEASIAAAIDPAYRAAHATVMREDGVHEPLPGDGPWLLACGDHVGRQWVAIDGLDARGTDTSLVSFPIDCGVRSPDTFALEPRANTRAPDAARTLAALVNRERIAAKLAPLAGDSRAGAAARATADLMVRLHQNAHELGGSTTADRLLAAGIEPVNDREMTLHAPDLATASELLANTPSYRAAVLAPEATHLGVAVERTADGQLAITLELVQIARPIDVDRLCRSVEQRLEALAVQLRGPRAGAARDILRETRALDSIAHELAASYAAGAPTDVVDSKVLPTDRYMKATRELTLLVSDEPDEIALGPTSALGLYDEYGVAAVQAPRDGRYAGRTWVVLLLGRRDF